MTLHTKYQGSMPCGFRQDVFMFFLNKPIHVTTRVGSFFAPGAYLNKVFISKIYF